MWFLKTFVPSIVITTAPTDRQVRRILWREIHAAYNRAKARGIDLGGELITKEWRFSEEHFALGFATRDYDANAFQGLHGAHIMVIADEAAGLTETIWEGIFSVLRGGHSRLLAIGNPTSVDGRFFAAFQSERWKTFHISAFDTPNLQGQGVVIPGLVTEEDVENAKEDWGEDSPLYVARILGRFPDVMEDTLITISMVERAGQGTWTEEEMAQEDPEEPIEIGADFARYGSDENVFIARRGRLAFDWESFGASALGNTGVMTAAGRLKNFIMKHYEAHKQATRKTGKRMLVKCDAVGLGGGVPDRLRELQNEGQLPRDIEIIDMNAGAKPNNPNKYYDAGTEMWVGLADRLKEDRAYGPVFAQKRVLAQLTGRKYQVLSDGRIKLESKEDMKKRGLHSPDWGDAICFAYAEVKTIPTVAPTPVGVGRSYWRRR